MLKFVRQFLVNTGFDFERYMRSAGITLNMLYASDLQLGFPIFDALYCQYSTGRVREHTSYGDKRSPYLIPTPPFNTKGASQCLVFLIKD